MSNAPDYSTYSNKDLIDVFNNIDKYSYPDRYETLCEIMLEKQLLIKADGTYTIELETIERVEREESNWPTKDDSPPEPSYTSSAPEPQYDEQGIYIPNEIPLKKRITNSVISLLIIAYGGYGIYLDSLWVPLAKKLVIVLHGVSTIIMFGAIICATLLMFVETLDHFDKRDNEHVYYKTAVYFKYAAFFLFGLAVIVGIFTGARLET
jgi:hypothetical protein